MLKKIVVIGPESTGKSVLCRQLAHHYHTMWCPEFARQYLIQHGTHYTYEDLLTIAKGQLALEDEYIKKMQEQSAASGQSSYLFIDTDMYVMKVWSEFVFGRCDRFILDQIVERKYDLYLLCNTDLPWIQDELREYPDLDRRILLYNMYKDAMMHQAVPWTEISGMNEDRLRQAIAAVDQLL